MIWNNHSNLSGQHAFLGASKYQWINYSDDKLIQTYDNMLAVQRGTELHALAEQCIRLRQKLQGKGTLASYVNDAIGFGMTPEVVLYFSDVCFGTADSIKFDEKKKFLRIHDLKTGVTPAHMEQLQVYAALFCLEYHFKPSDIQMELRIYQNNEVQIFEPSVEHIAPIMDKAISFTKKIHDHNLIGAR
jgi:hypothetical protein